MRKDELVEKCAVVVPDYFLLVVLSAYRAQELASGMSSFVSANGEKGTILSLKEIAEKQVDLDALKERVISSFQQFSFLSKKPN